MTVDEMLRELDYDDRGPEAGVLLTLKEAKAIQAKLRAAEALAEVVDDLYGEADPIHMQTLFGPDLEARLSKCLDDYDKAGTEDAKK